VVPHQSSSRFLVAHGLRLKGFADAPDLARLTNLDAAAVTRHLAELREMGQAKYRSGRVTGWALTPEGRTWHAAACAEDLAVAGCADAVRASYEQFLALNPALLALCTDWQLRGGPEQLNDHLDRAYDEAVVARLVVVDVAVRPVLDELGERMIRFGGYRSRLSGARKRVQSGEHDWFTGAMIDSYHTVWFELHEDLLATLGIERSKEDR
jgi:DNA-binding MarR family transcriptional regulator